MSDAISRCACALLPGLAFAASLPAQEVAGAVQGEGADLVLHLNWQEGPDCRRRPCWRCWTAPERRSPEPAWRCRGLASRRRGCAGSSA